MVRRPPDIEFALLGFLLQGPQHGYQIHQMVSDPSGLGLIWHLKQSHLYAMLNQLESDGYVTSVFQNQDPHPPRRVFELTETGNRVFFDWLTSPVMAPRLIRQHFFAKLYFAQKEDANIAIKLIELQKSICQTWINEFKEKLTTSKKTSFYWSMYKYRLGQVQALQDWLDSY
ncbi:MAG: PadR family transcriptional regulator [Anaerolineales bacterium]